MIASSSNDTNKETAEEQPQRRRIVWIDYARAFAILTVILCHSTEAVYSMSLDAMSSASIASRITCFTLFTIGRLGVPIFLFISGYLMLDRKYDKAACLHFWKTNWLGLVCATEIWIVVYNFFLSLFEGAPFDLGTLIKNMLFLENVNMAHIWYMPMIIGLYLFLPFIAAGLRKLDNAKLLLFPLSIAVLFLFVVPILNILLQCMGYSGIRSEIAPGWSGGAYGCYMLLGYCAKKKLFKTPTALLSSIFLLAIVAIVTLQIYAYSCGVLAPIWYENALLLIASLALFLIFSYRSKIRESRIIYMISYYSFALYLVHFPVKIILAPLIIDANIGPHILQVGTVFFSVFVISFILCIAIAKIPIFGKRALYLK